MKKGDRVFVLVGMGLSFWLIWEGLRYDYMTMYTPGPGFLPFWLGACLASLSLSLLFKTLRRKGGGEEERSRLPGGKSLLRVGLILLFTGGFVFSMATLGFALAVMLLVFVILFVLERYTLLKSILYGIAMSGAVFLIFRYWLNIELPKGLLGL